MRRLFPRRRLRARALVSLAVAAVVALVMAASEHTPRAAGSYTFGYTGGVQYWTVPAGVTSVTVRVNGGGGGNGWSNASGGSGARVQITMPVTPGQTFTLDVGGKGEDIGGFGAGGYGGGGAGGAGYYGGAGAGGGGATKFSLGATTLIIAGGGGGGGGYNANGGSSSSAGADSQYLWYYGGGAGGGAGTASAGGAGGTSTCCGAGTAGALGVGGNGGDDGGWGYMSGGGGGGYYGGGGAGGGGYYGAGGGGGSNYVDPGLVGAVVTDGKNGGNGKIEIFEGLPPPARLALVNDSTVSGGASSQEALTAIDQGFEVDVVSDVTWASMTAAQFGQYDLLIAGDPTCSSIAGGLLSSASVWGPVVLGLDGGRTLAGNRIVIGTDPVFHDGGRFSPQAAIIRDGIAFAGKHPGRTGMYFTATCGGWDPSLPAALAAMSTGTGTWTVNSGPPCGGSASLIASEPTFDEVTTSSLQGWGCSVHESFPTFPSDWSALAVATDTPTHPTCGVDPGTGLEACGEAYILIAGSSIVVVSANLSLSPLDATNPVGTLHTVTAHVTRDDVPLAGQAITFTVTGVNAGAVGTCVPAGCVTDSNGDVSFTWLGSGGVGDDTVKASFTDINGSLQAATAQKHWTEVTNNPPDAVCQNVTVNTDPGACSAAGASVDNGSSDPDGDAITLDQSPAAPYSLGDNAVTLTAMDPDGASDSCTATVTVVDAELPSIACPAPQTIECTANSAAGATIGSPTSGDNCSVASAGCSASSGPFPVGTTNYSCSVVDGSGNGASCTSSVTVVDTVGPAVSCVESYNPSTRNVPRASDTNQDGFYLVTGGDTCSVVTIKIGDYTVAAGETIKITQTPGKSGVALVNVMGGTIKHFQVGPGDATLTATDEAGNSSTATCLVPPRPR